MELRTASSPRDVKTYDTARLREEFLIQDLFQQARKSETPFSATAQGALYARR